MAIRIGIIAEEKVPEDRRAPLTPAQARALQVRYPDVQVVVQTSALRCFSDAEYEAAGISVVEEVADCAIVLGVKEPRIAGLLPDKTYLFFSHTAKKQSYNKPLLRAVLDQRIRLIDYEYLVEGNRARVIAFGRFAGLVGAHNILWAYGQRHVAHALPRAVAVGSVTGLFAAYEGYQTPPLRVVVLGKGRVSKGAIELLTQAGFAGVSPSSFLKEGQRGVYTVLNPVDYHQRKDGSKGTTSDFRADPQAYESTFLPYAQAADVLISGVYWDVRAPRVFTLPQLRSADFTIRYIADITCDIDGSIPTTQRSTTIDDPLYYYVLSSGALLPHPPEGDVPYVCVMAVDNLPNELPQDASAAFGEQLSEKVIKHLIASPYGACVQRAIIAEAGKLAPAYAYLQDWVYGA